MDNWQAQLDETAERYVKGADAVQARRRDWRTGTRNKILAVLLAAAKRLSEKGLSASAHRVTDDFDDEVRLALGTFGTGRTRKFRRDGSNVQEFEYEGGARLVYALLVDGRIAAFRFMYTMDANEVRQVQALEVLEPGDVDEDAIRRHVVEFLDEAFRSSFRGPGPKPAAVRLGFRPDSES